MDYIYITTGTYDFLKRLHQKYQKETMIMMTSTEHALLLHESTRRKSVFQLPRKYEVIEKHGELPHEGFAVFHYIPVLEESRPVFEHQLSKRSRIIEHTPGFLTSRILRPIKNDTYLIITFWESEASFEKRRDSFDGLIEIEKKDQYPRPSFLKNYYLDKEDN